MDNKERQEFDELLKKVKTLEKELTDLKRLQENQVFDSRVTFRKPVYNRLGKRVIN